MQEWGENNLKYLNGTGKQAITMEVLEDFIRVTHLSNDHLLYLIRDQESGKELQPMIIRKHFTAEEMQKAFEFLSDEPEFTNEINILSNYPEKQKRKLINNMISLLKNERDH